MILQRQVVLFGIMPALAVFGAGVLWKNRSCGEDRRPGRQSAESGCAWKRWLLAALIFFCIGMLRAWFVQSLCDRELALKLDGQKHWVYGTVETLEEKESWLVVGLNQVTVGKAGSPRRMQIYLERGDELSELQIGNRIKVWGECSAFEPAHNPGEFNYQTYYRSLQLTYRMFGLSWEMLDAGTNRWSQGLYQISKWGGERLSLLAEADAGAFRAMLLGQKSALSEQLRSLYQKNGIAHLLAVSGLHLSLVSLAVYGGLRKAGAGFRLAGVVAGVALMSYAALTGASSSVIRALCMVLCGFLAASMGRSYDLLSALGLSAILILWDSPYQLCQAGVQLSFGAVFSIGGLSAWLGREQGHNGFYVSAALQLVTFPLVLYHFFQYPLYGVFLNLLVVPLMGVVVGTGSVALLLSLKSLAAGRFAIAGGCAVLRWYELCCHAFEGIPGSSVILGRPEIWQVGIYYGLLAVLVLRMQVGTGGADGIAEKTAAEAVDGASKGFVAGAVDGASKGFVAGAVDGASKETVERHAGGTPIGVVLLLLSAMMLVLLPLPVPGLRAAFLDVGQGDGICMQTGRHVILVDGGSTDEKNLGEQRLEPYLKSRGIRTVDYAIVSHGDQDHISGLVYLLKESEDIHVSHLILPKAGRGDEVYDELSRLILARGGDVAWMEQGDELFVGRLSVQCIWPRKPVLGNGSATSSIADRNEHSLVLRVDYGEFHMLLTGDMSGEGESRLLSQQPRLSDIQVLKIAHHGSRFSTTEAWLDAVRPQWAVISYGKGNRYGHPDESILERLEERGTKRYETALSGAVWLDTDGRRIHWTEYMK